MSRDIIELVDLTKRYGNRTVVNRLNLSIHKGEIFGLLGPNGAGKSTTILMMLGLTEPTSGNVIICGINSTTHPVEVKRKVGYLPEDVGFYEDRTGLENMVYTGRLNRLTKKEALRKAGILLDRVGLTGEEDKKVKKYSRGMRQRLGLADVLMKDPEVIILDEPTLGIDPEGVKELLELIMRLSHEEGLTVALSSHDLHQVQKVCDRVGLFVGGELVAVGDIHTLSQKLFSHEPYTIHAGISLNGARPSFTKEELLAAIKRVNGVKDVSMDDNMFQVGCSWDASAEIAKVVVESGFGLQYLQRKEFGLNEIYHRYFEGGSHE